MDFDYDSFAGLVDEIRGMGYRFLRIDQEPEDARCFYLRHDVDLSARAAATMGEIEHRRGLQASFFFLLGGDSYNLLGDENLAIVQELRRMGHCVGLHIDERLIAEDEKRVADTLRWFSTSIREIDPVASFHRPSRSVLGRAYRGFASAYRPGIFSPGTYLSDSRRSADFAPALRSWIREGRTPIQLLLHPGWWYPAGTARGVWDGILERRARECEAYLLRNFGKVFGGFGSDEDRTSGL